MCKEGEEMVGGARKGGCRGRGKKEEGGVENLNVRTKETFHQMIEANSKSCRANNKSLYFITDFIRINIGGHHLFQPLIKQNNNDSGCGP